MCYITKTNKNMTDTTSNGYFQLDNIIDQGIESNEYKREISLS